MTLSRQTMCSLAAVALAVSMTSCQSAVKTRVGNGDVRIKRPRPPLAYRTLLSVAEFATSSTTASGFDTERLWGRENDWEPAVAVAPDTGYVYQLTTRYGVGGTPDPAVIFRRSIDNGATWEPEQPIFDSGTWQVDPIIEAVGDGVVIAAWLQNWDTFVSRSDDYGVSWSTPLALLDSGGPSFTDFPRLVVAPGGQDVYIAFNSGDSYVSVSHDGGVTFAAPQLTDSGPATWFHSGGEIAPNGDVYFAATVYDASDASTVRVLRSVDDGDTWSSAEIDGSTAPPGCALPGCPSFFLGPSAAIAIDSAGTIMVAYHKGEIAGAPQKLYVRTSTDGVSWSAQIEVSDAADGTHHAFPALGAGLTPGDFRVCWQDDRNGPIAWNTWLRRTTDGGTSWQGEIRVSDLGSGAPYKSAAGYQHPYGDYLELEVDANGRTHMIWGEGTSYSGPGGAWYTRGLPESTPFIRGDANADGSIDLADGISSLSYLFDATPNGCLDALDVNDDGVLDIGDPIYGLAYLFSGGPPPPEPTECGSDPTPDSLGCVEYAACPRAP